MPMPNARSRMTRNSVMAMIGVARTWIQAVAYSAQQKSGIRNHVIPGARSRWMVVMKLMPGEHRREAEHEGREHRQRDVGAGLAG